MNSLLRKYQSDIDALCRKYGVLRLELFGSATGPAFDPTTSDYDFLVEFGSRDQPGYADRYLGLMEELTSLLGRPVDLVVERAIRNPYFKEGVNRSRQLLYAA